MRLIASLRLIPLKLHTKTIIIISFVLLTVFAVIAYFSDLATNNLNTQQEQEQAKLFAAQVADTVLAIRVPPPVAWKTLSLQIEGVEARAITPRHPRARANMPRG